MDLHVMYILNKNRCMYAQTSIMRSMHAQKRKKLKARNIPNKVRVVD